MNDSNQIFSQILDKSRAAAAGDYGVLSAGERLVAAIVLNRADWLEQENYTLAEAIVRIGPKWIAQIPAVAKQLAAEQAVVQEGMHRASRQARVDALLGSDDDEVKLAVTFRTHGYAPGYRDVDLMFAARSLYASSETRPKLVTIRVRPGTLNPSSVR
jgi:hypothetical protein